MFLIKNGDEFFVELLGQKIPLEAAIKHHFIDPKDLFLLKEELNNDQTPGEKRIEIEAFNELYQFKNICRKEVKKIKLDLSQLSLFHGTEYFSPLLKHGFNKAKKLIEDAYLTYANANANFRSCLEVDLKKQQLLAEIQHLTKQYREATTLNKVFANDTQDFANIVPNILKFYIKSIEFAKFFGDERRYNCKVKTFKHQAQTEDLQDFMELTLDDLMGLNRTASLKSIEPKPSELTESIPESLNARLVNATQEIKENAENDVNIHLPTLSNISLLWALNPEIRKAAGLEALPVEISNAVSKAKEKGLKKRVTFDDESIPETVTLERRTSG